MKRSASGSGSASPARGVAHRVLLRVAEDDAWAERALNGVLNRTQVSPRDAALATELVYGTLRNERWLDFILSCAADKPLKKLPRAVLVTLRMATYELLELRTPDHPVVNDAVNLVRPRHKRLTGLTNALLRKIARARDSKELPRPEDRIEDAIEAMAVRGSHPTWLVRRVEALIGPDELPRWIEANNSAPPVALRVNSHLTQRDALVDALRAAEVEIEVPDAFPDAVFVRSGGRVELLPGFKEGHFFVQDPAAQLAGRLAGVKPGQIALDACAAPGGKATHLAELMGNQGRVLAADVHLAKTRLIADNAARLQLDIVKPIAVDTSDPDELRYALEDAEVELLDLAIIDAPCSGFGTLRRNPELRRRGEAELGRLVELQAQLLESVAGFVRPGGHLVYMVCTVLPEEGIQRVEKFLAEHSEFTLDRPSDVTLQPFLDDHGQLVTWPHRHGVDGFFGARLARAKT